MSEGRKNHHGQSHSYKIIEILFLFVCMYREISTMIVTKLTEVMFMLLDLRVFKRYFVSLLAFSIVIMPYLYKNKKHTLKWSLEINILKSEIGVPLTHLTFYLQF